MIVSHIKNNYKRKIKRKIINGLIYILKEFTIPIIIIFLIMFFICYISEIFYLGINNEEKSNMKKEIKYYTTQEYTDEDSKSFFASINDFIANIFESDFAENADWPVEKEYRISSYYGKRVAPTTGASTFHSRH